MLREDMPIDYFDTSTIKTTAYANTPYADVCNESNRHFNYSETEYNWTGADNEASFAGLHKINYLSTDNKFSNYKQFPNQTGRQKIEQLPMVHDKYYNSMFVAVLFIRKYIPPGTIYGARYGLRRIIDGIVSAWPLHRVSGSGDIEELGTLSALTSNEYFLASSRRQFARGGLYQGIPCFLQDQRPGGFLGRAVPRRYPELQLPERVIDWNDDHYLRYLTQRGSDAVGDLILGTAALDDYLRIRSARTLVQTSQRQVHYPELANLVMAGGLPGSSAHGEQPKFAAILQEGPRAWHVLVKFSPPADTLIGVRWSDLLV